MHAEVRGRSQVGGIAGVSEGLVMYSYVANKNANSGSPGLGVTGNDKVGGIAGEVLNEGDYNYGVMYSVAVVDVAGSTNTAGVVGLASTSGLSMLVIIPALTATTTLHQGYKRHVTLVQIELLNNSKICPQMKITPQMTANLYTSLTVRELIIMYQAHCPH